MNEQERYERIDDVQRFLDWLGDHPEVPIPIEFGKYGTLTISASGREEFGAIARAFGTAKKIVDNTFIQLRRKFGLIEVVAIEYRDAVCERRVVGVETVEQRVPTAFETKIVEREVVEWDCGSLLKGVVGEGVQS